LHIFELLFVQKDICSENHLHCAVLFGWQAWKLMLAFSTSSHQSVIWRDQYLKSETVNKMHLLLWEVTTFQTVSNWVAKLNSYGYKVFC